MGKGVRLEQERISFTQVQKMAEIIDNQKEAYENTTIY
jgi:hypothetical protein